ncbi:MAG: hypothetical protein E7561_02370 [Ruminococcaceae bacterium]|nr:hypothetical protein [Oscillospiraceae bacterium]
MKKFTYLILCLMLAFSFNACKSKSDNATNSDLNISSQETVSDENSISSNKNIPNQPAKKSVYVVKNFLAIEGAVIYDQTYDEYGYPNCCYFHKKCESCGDVSNNNGSARSNLTTSYYCPKCKTSNQVEIKADAEWIEVYE